MEILKFLSPYWAGTKLEILPIVFFSLILITFLSTLFLMYRNAKENKWDENWLNNHLDIEQGSISELSSSVATKSENMADVMPGIILIIGLLGTFIGLGLALDSASGILGDTSSDMDSKMFGLTSMMEGLGAKFKTSTWGLMAFLLLKFFASKNNYEARRLNWVANKIKSVLDLNRQNQADLQQKNQQAVLDSIKLLMDNLIHTQNMNHKANNSLLNDVNAQQMKVMDRGYLAIQLANKEAHSNLLEAINELFTKLIASQEKVGKENQSANNTAHANLLTSVGKLFANLVLNQEKISETNQSLLKSLSQSQLLELKQGYENQQKATQSMSRSLEETFTAQFANLVAKQLEQTESTQQSLAEMADKICQSVKLQQEKVVEAVDKNSHYLDKTAKESEQTRGAMDKFVNQSLTSITKLKEASEGMSKAAGDIGGSAAKLQTVIDNLSTEMKTLIGLMKKDLGDTIHNMDKSFVQNMDKLSQNLTTTIGDMNKSFKQNMTEMSSDLGKATKDISNAVNSLSKSVENTMNEVSKTINESMVIQKEAQCQFTLTAEELDESIEAVTNLVNKLSNDIRGGLAAVSDSNRNMIALDKRYNSSSKQIEALLEQVEKVAGHNSELKSVLTEISNKMPQSNQSVLNNIKSISDSMLEEQKRQSRLLGELKHNQG